MRPIDADVARKRLIVAARLFKACEGGKPIAKIIGVLINRIDRIPTLDYAPVKHGEFERQPEEYIVGLHVTPIHCKTCDTTYFTLNKDGKRTICCPYCGARMDKKEDGKDEVH